MPRDHCLRVREILVSHFLFAFFCCASLSFHPRSGQKARMVLACAMSCTPTSTSTLFGEPLSVSRCARCQIPLGRSDRSPGLPAPQNEITCHAPIAIPFPCSGSNRGDESRGGSSKHRERMKRCRDKGWISQRSLNRHIIYNEEKERRRRREWDRRPTSRCIQN